MFDGDSALSINICNLETARTLGLGFRASQGTKCKNKVTREGLGLESEVTEGGIHGALRRFPVHGPFVLQTHRDTQDWFEEPQ